MNLFQTKFRLAVVKELVTIHFEYGGTNAGAVKLPLKGFRDFLEDIADIVDVFQLLEPISGQDVAAIFTTDAEDAQKVAAAWNAAELEEEKP